MIESKLEEIKLKSKKDCVQYAGALLIAVIAAINYIEALQNTATIILIFFVFICYFLLFLAHHRDEVREISRKNQKFTSIRC